MLHVGGERWTVIILSKASMMLSSLPNFRREAGLRALPRSPPLFRLRCELNRTPTTSSTQRHRLLDQHARRSEIPLEILADIAKPLWSIAADYDFVQHGTAARSPSNPCYPGTVLTERIAATSNDASEHRRVSQLSSSSNSQCFCILEQLHRRCSASGSSPERQTAKSICHTFSSTSAAAVYH